MRERAGALASIALISLALLVMEVRLGGAAHADTRDVFADFSKAVLKIEVIEAGSGAKSVIGSGFHLGDAGLIATNYHVISKLVQHPGRYRAEAVRGPDERWALELLAVDAVHDLAIARGKAAKSPLRLSNTSTDPDKGSRLYAFGYPHDLGLSVVEGTHNGLLEHSVHAKIHFTGAINSGMSGGPAILDTGEVVGVNVASAGNAVGFLVPSRHLNELVSPVSAHGFSPPENFLDEVRAQVHESQRDYLQTLLDGALPTTSLGRFQVPSALLPTFHCWGDALREEDLPYEAVSHECSTQDYVYLSASHWAGVIRFRHQLLESDELGALRFAELYEAEFADGQEWLSGEESEVTRFECDADSIDVEGRVFKTALCARAYRKLPGLYDVVLKSAALGLPGEGLVSSLTLSGVGFEEGTRFARHFLEAIQWTP